MKKIIFFTLFVLAFMSGSALAGPPNLLGTWEGSGRAIFMDGTVDELSTRIVVTSQVDNLFAATFALSIEPDGENWFDCPSANGHISRHKIIRGVVQDYGETPGAIFDAKWMGKQIKGVMRDFGVMSTIQFKVRWVSHSLDPGCHN